MDYFITLNEKSIDAIGEAVEKPITVIEGLKEDIAELEQTVAEKDEIIADKDEEIAALEQQLANAPITFPIRIQHNAINLPAGCAIGIVSDNKQQKIVGVDHGYNQFNNAMTLAVMGDVETYRLRTDVLKMNAPGTYGATVTQTDNLATVSVSDLSSVLRITLTFDMTAVKTWIADHPTGTYSITINYTYSA